MCSGKMFADHPIKNGEFERVLSRFVLSTNNWVRRYIIFIFILFQGQIHFLLRAVFPGVVFIFSVEGWFFKASKFPLITIGYVNELVFWINSGFRLFFLSSLKKS